MMVKILTRSTRLSQVSFCKKVKFHPREHVVPLRKAIKEPKRH